MARFRPGLQEQVGARPVLQEMAVPLVEFVSAVSPLLPSRFRDGGNP